MNVCKEAKNPAGLGVERILSSVYGRIISVAGVTNAVDVAALIRDVCAAKGVELQIGIACGGRIENTNDPGMPNLAGQPLNLAARAAFLKDEKNNFFDNHIIATRVAVDQSSVKALFEEPVERPVKGIKLDCQLHRGPLPTFGMLDCPSIKDFMAHAIAYDIQRYSGKEAEDAARVIEELGKQVLSAANVVGWMDAGNSTRPFSYSPAGDGGIFVVPDTKGYSDRAFEFAEKLLGRCGEKIPIRVGIATGSCAILEDDPPLPVGVVVINADKTSAIPPAGRMAVTLLFWNGRDEATKKRYEPPEQSDPFILYPKGSKPPTDQSDLNALCRQTYPKTCERITALLNAKPALSAWLVNALKNQFQHPRTNVPDPLDLILDLHWITLFREIYVKLSSRPNDVAAEDISKFLNDLPVVKIPPDWVIATRQLLQNSDTKCQNLLRDSNNAMAEILKAAIFDAALHGANPTGAPIKGARQVDLEKVVESRSPSIPGEMRELQQALRTKVNLITNDSLQATDPDLVSKLQGILEGGLDVGKPFFVVLRESKVTSSDLLEHKNIVPFQSLLTFIADKSSGNDRRVFESMTSEGI